MPRKRYDTAQTTTPPHTLLPEFGVAGGGLRGPRKKRQRYNDWSMGISLVRVEKKGRRSRYQKEKMGNILVTSRTPRHGFKEMYWELP